MELNRWPERMVFHTLTGRAENMESVRKVAREWLDQGEGCARPESVARLTVG